MLFYSTFAALKAQDSSAPLDDSDYFYQPNEEQFGAYVPPFPPRPL